MILADTPGNDSASLKTPVSANGVDEIINLRGIQRELRLIQLDSRKNGLYGDMITPLGNLRLAIESAEMFGEFQLLAQMGLSSFFDRKVLYINSALSRINETDKQVENCLLLGKQIDDISPIEVIRKYDEKVIEINKLIYEFGLRIEKGSIIEQTDLDRLSALNEQLIAIVEGDDTFKSNGLI